LRRFAALYRALDTRTGTTAKRRALMQYFREAPAADAAWALWFLCGGRLRRIANGTELREWLMARAALPEWLVSESIHHVGDVAEAMTLLLDDPPPAQRLDLPLSEWVEQRLLPVAGGEPAARRAAVAAGWDGLPEDERLLFNKLITGELRVGVSQRAVQQALAELSGLDIARIAQRMLGKWTPSTQFLAQLLSQEVSAADRAQPYPFYLASPLEDPPASLGPIDDWLLEWKWDGIRLQLIRRGAVALWSRGEERLDGRFPEIEAAAAALPEGTVLDGELLAWREGDDQPLPFTELQKRINRLQPSAKLLNDVPARVLTFDLLEEGGTDIRARSLAERRERLQALIRRLDRDARLAVSPRVAAARPGGGAGWDAAIELQRESRSRGAEGLMLKRLASPYRVGRPRGDWWKWKVDPFTVDAVLIYAQTGHGRRSTLYTDYTFGLWDGDTLVPVAKAYSGLNDEEILTLDRWIRAHTLERFGPVRAVEPAHVFELGFEAVNRSTRHKSGVAVRFPRILRWRTDKPAAEADRIETLRRLAQRAVGGAPRHSAQ
jgi:DNA ligase-1